MTIHQAYQQLLLQLYDLYSDREAANIADRVIEHVTGQRRIDRITYKDIPVNNEQQDRLNIITGKLLQHTPVQYALNEAWFYGMNFYVDENVLIPRPETEELVEWIVAEVSSKHYEAPTILDIGTGSGCIPIALEKKLPGCSISAIEVSEGALNVAAKNAGAQGTDINFMHRDFLDENTWEDCGRFDIIVSNPPYVRLGEACTMDRNVLEHEPHLALFVPDQDPLLFYRKIEAFARHHLEDNGAIFLEINETSGKDVTALFETGGYAVELKKDMQHKDRMIKAVKCPQERLSMASHSPPP